MPRRKGGKVAMNLDGTVRKTSSDKKNPVLPKLDDDTFFKLKLLANVCDQFHTHLAEDILEMALNHPDIINHFQNKYRAVNRILPWQKVIFRIPQFFQSESPSDLPGLRRTA